MQKALEIGACSEARVIRRFRRFRTRSLGNQLSQVAKLIALQGHTELEPADLLLFAGRIRSAQRPTDGACESVHAAQRRDDGVLQRDRRPRRRLTGHDVHAVRFRADVQAERRTGHGSRVGRASPRHGRRRSRRRFLRHTRPSRRMDQTTPTRGRAQGAAGSRRRRSIRYGARWPAGTASRTPTSRPCSRTSIDSTARTSASSDAAAGSWLVPSRHARASRTYPVFLIETPPIGRPPNPRTRSSSLPTSGRPISRPSWGRDCTCCQASCRSARRPRPWFPSAGASASPVRR